MKQNSSYEADFFVILAQSILYEQRSVGRWERFERNLLFNNAVYFFLLAIFVWSNLIIWMAF